MNLPSNEVTRAIGRQLLKAKTHSPTILFAAGVAGVVGGTILACKATLDLHETLDGIQEDLEAAKANHPQITDDVGQLTKEVNRDVAKVYLHGTYRISRLYAPAVLLTGAGLAAVTGSHVILTRRNTAVTAAYAALAHSYEDYRGRVREEVGDEKELTLYRAIEWIDVEGADGMIQEPANAPGSWGNPYTRFFDETNPNWTNSEEMNLFFIECQERYYNHVLTTRGHVFLNEVYSNLGIPHSREGQAVGWLLDNDSFDGGDNYVDFGVYQAVNTRDPDNRQKAIVLDFNVDGIIMNKIPEFKG
jgi:hypothetical protein